MTEEIRTEALIVGGGMVGLSLGLALAQGGVDVVVLDRAVSDCANLRHLAPANVNEVQRRSNGVSLRLADGRRLAAKLLVAADGRESLLRRWAQIPVLRWSYPQTGIVATVAHELPH